MRKFADFNALAERAMGRRLFDESRYWFVETLNLQKQDQTYRINLIGLNSCLFSGYDGDDRQKLALGLHQVNQALEQLNEGTLSIGFFHHPFSCYHRADRVCQNLLMNRLDLILTGHLHEPSNAFIHNAAGIAVVIGAGAGFETRENENSFNLVEIDPETGEGKIQFYKYLPEHNRWKMDTDVNPDSNDGSFSFVIGKLNKSQLEVRDRQDIVTEQVAGTVLSEMRESYLNRLLCDSGILSLEGIDPKAASGERESRLNLGAVYTALLTHSSEARPEDREEFHREEKRQTSALEVLNQHQHVVLLGDPGSGKTTFVNFMTWCLAGELLGHAEANLELLTRPAPTDEGNDEEKPQPWQHGPLLPVRIILRDFAAKIVLQKEVSASELWRFMEKALAKAELSDFAPYLKQELLHKGGLLMLDGLDEVPEADNRRVQIKQVVEDFIKTFHKCRVLVTSRTYAYQKQDWRIPGLYESVLAPFSSGQIRRFIDRWYAHVAELRRSNPEDAQGRAELLKRTIFTNDRLRELAARPLLLTLMASLHSWRGGSLPEKREELYDATVDLLLDWWERPKMVRGLDGRYSLVQPSLMEWLKTDRTQMRRLLNELAYKAHATQPELTGTADIDEGELVQGLWRLSQNPEVNPRKLMDYLSQRAGLLLPRGVEVYSFPHRTFQEYLAACHLTDLDYPDQVAKLCRDEPDRWREVCLLAGAKAARGASSSIWSLAEALCYQETDNPKAEPADLWGAQLAGQALAETAILGQISPHNQKKLDRVKSWLVLIVEGNELPATERAEAGNVLARLGEPRLEVVTLDKIAFCFVTAGPFRMAEGKDKALNKRLNYSYWISRFPVTHAQYDEFVKAGGYKEGRYWKEAVERGLWKSGVFTGEYDRISQPRPRDYGTPFNLSNHPVVGVSWYESIAFTRWLTEMWQQRFGVQLMIRLPLEAEWEKAARGGLEIPEQKIIVSAAEPQFLSMPPVHFKTNPNPGREYPWGDILKMDIADRNKANYDDTGVGTTTTVGCFSAGNSPYGCQDMSGNVWEWCMDLLEGSARVLRGGSWVSHARSCRCAIRLRIVPGRRNSNFGFRLVLLPGQQASGAEQPAPQT